MANVTVHTLPAENRSATPSKSDRLALFTGVGNRYLQLLDVLAMTGLTPAERVLILENLGATDAMLMLLTTSTVAVANTAIVNLAATQVNDASTIFAIAAPPANAGSRFSATLHLEIGNYTGSPPRAEFTIVEIATDGTRTTLVDQRDIFIQEQNFTPINIQPDDSTSALEIQVFLRTRAAFGNATAQVIDQSWIEPGRLEARARVIADEEAKKAVGLILNTVKENEEGLTGKADTGLANLLANLTADQRAAIRTKLGVIQGLNYTVGNANTLHELLIGVEETVHTPRNFLLTLATIGAGAGTRYGFDREAAAGEIASGFGDIGNGNSADAASVQHIVWYPATANSLLRNRYSLEMSGAKRVRSVLIGVVAIPMTYSHSTGPNDFYTSTQTYLEQSTAGQVIFNLTFADGTHLRADANVKTHKKLGLAGLQTWLGLNNPVATSTAYATDGATAKLRWDDLDITDSTEENANTDNPPSDELYYSGATVTVSDATVLNGVVGTAEVTALAASTNASKIFMVDTNRTYFGRLKIGPASGQSAGQGNLNFTAQVAHCAADGTVKDQRITNGRWLNLSYPNEFDFTVHSGDIAAGDYLTFQLIQRLSITTLAYVEVTLSSLVVDAALPAGSPATAQATELLPDTKELTYFGYFNNEPELFPIVAIADDGAITEADGPWSDTLAIAKAIGGGANLWIARSRGVRAAGQPSYDVTQWAIYQATGNADIIAIQYSATIDALDAGWHAVLAVGDRYGRVRGGNGQYAEPFVLAKIVDAWRFVTNLGWGGGPILKTLVTPFDFAGIREVQFRYAALNADYTDVMWRAFTYPMPTSLIPINPYRVDGNYGLGDGLSTYVEFQKTAASFALHGSQFDTPSALTNFRQEADLNFVALPADDANYTATRVGYLNVARAGHMTGLIEVYGK